MSDECYTPRDIVEIARETMGSIDLDPASCFVANEVVRAARYFTIEDNGLEQEWCPRWWNNEPFSDPAPWVEKACRCGVLGCQLLPVSTGVSWWRMVWDWPIMWIGRLTFWGPGAITKNGERTGSRQDIAMVLYHGTIEAVERFYRQGRLHGYRVTWDRPALTAVNGGE